MSNVLLCRYGELFLKLGNRGRFEQQLATNVRAALRGLPDTVVETPHGRIIVRTGAATVDEACARVERVFGLVSVSPALQVEAEPDLAAVTAAALRVAAEALERDPARRRSFRIEARRSDKGFPLRSQEIATQVGAAVNRATGVPVDLSNPALVVGVEIAQPGAWVYADSRPAPGGLPVGTAGKAVLLLSGGIDSPVAGWLAAKRGLELHGLYFHSPPFVGDRSRDKVADLGRTLFRWQALKSLQVVNFTETQKRLREAGPAELAVVLYRRMMMRVADVVADQLKAQALVTGENLGQVASQTLTNIATIEGAARHLVLRPLLTYDKQETVGLARRIGTYDLSVLPYDDCCSLFLPAHPATNARAVDAERAEAQLDVQAEAAAMAAPGALEMIALGDRLY
jgi:thiamine biosynthesis protein ThiI